MNTELDRTCWCTHTGHDHDAGECWAQVTTSDGTTGQCGCNWWEPIDPARRLLAEILAVINRHQGRNDTQAMAEIHEVCMAALQRPTPQTTLPPPTGETP
jgi:hypothetical protein